MVDRHTRHHRVNRIVVKRQSLGAGRDRRCSAGRALGGRWARIVALGSTASTLRSAGS
jgi:hypothetical protein